MGLPLKHWLKRFKKTDWEGMVALSRQEEIPRRNPVIQIRFNTLMLLVALVGLPVWFYMLYRSDHSGPYRLKASTGNHAEQQFLYFLYYKNLFPVASTEAGKDTWFIFNNEDVPPEPNRLQYSQEAAEKVIREKPETLVMEWGHTLRGGNLLRTFLFLPHAWRLKSPENAKIQFANSLAFTTSLWLLFIAFVWAGRPILGLILVALLGSNPFQLNEVFWNGNIFGWPITIFTLMLAINLPFLSSKSASKYYYLVAAVVSGGILATAHQIRPEPTVSLFAVALTYLLATHLKWVWRLCLVALLGAVFVLGLRAWENYFEAKYQHAKQVVTQAGGHPYLGSRTPYHHFWHTLWCGLGDYGQKYGYSWKDHVAISYAEPLLKQRYNIDLPWWWGVKSKTKRGDGDFYDRERIYYKIPWELPEYHQVLKEKVLRDIKNDPLWYVGILLKRVWRVLNETAPVRIVVPPLIKVPVPFHGLMLIPVLFMVIWRRNGFLLRLILFSLPLSGLSVLLYSGGNMTYYSTYPMVTAAILLAFLIELALSSKRLLRLRR